MKAIILTGRFGMGHYSASAAIKQQIEDEIADAQIEIIDIFEYVAPKLQNIVYTSFNLLVSKANKIYNFVCKNTPEFDSTIPFTNIFIKKIEELIEEKSPDYVISTLPFCSRIMSEFKEKTGMPIPLITCITDVSTHSEWVSSQTNIYLVASDSVKQSLVQGGTAPDDIIVCGIPVKLQFKKIAEKRAAQISTPSGVKNILVMGGGLGLFTLEKDFFETLDRAEGIKTTVITGNNKKAYNALYGKYENIEVVGYTDEVHKYMAEADLMISKSGGISLFEAIYAELPMLIITPFLEQEKYNACFIEQKWIGEVMWDKQESTAIRAIRIVRSERKLAFMRKNMKQLVVGLSGRVTSEILDKLSAFRAG